MSVNAVIKIGGSVLFKSGRLRQNHVKKTFWKVIDQKIEGKYILVLGCGKVTHDLTYQSDLRQAEGHL